MTDTAAVERTPLAPDDLLHLLMARNWLAMGSIDEARREFDCLPQAAKSHPEAAQLRHQLFSRC